MNNIKNNNFYNKSNYDDDIRRKSFSQSLDINNN